MAIQVSLFSVLLFISAIITMALAFYGWRNRSIPICKPFTLLMGAATLWTIGEAVQTLNIDLATSLMVNVIEYPGIVTVPVAWFILSLYYSGRERFVTRKILVLLFVIPAISTILVATNPLHYLYYNSITPLVLNGTTIWHYNHGPLFQVLILYSYILASLAFLIVVGQLFAHSDYYRRQTAILLIASAIPFAFNIIYVLQPAGFPQFDITPFSFTLMGILIAVGIIRFRLFSLMPVAHTHLFNGINDAVFVTDPGDTIIDLNPAALNLLAIPGKESIGRNFGELFPDFVSQNKDFFTIPGEPAGNPYLPEQGDTVL